MALRDVAGVVLCISWLAALGGLATIAHADEPRCDPERLLEDAFSVEHHPAEKDEEATAEGPWLSKGDEAAAERLVRRLRAATWRLRLAAYAFDRLPGSLGVLGASPSALLDESSKQAVGSAVRSGSLRLVHAVHGDGRFGEILRVRELEERNVVLRRGMESAQDAVVVFPMASRIRAGLRLRARLLPTAAGGATVRYRIALLGRPDVEAKDTVGGELDHVTIPAFLAEGTTRLDVGDVAALVDLRADGRGHLLLLSLERAEATLPPVSDLGGGLVAVLAEHLDVEKRWLDARMPGVISPWGDGAPRLGDEEDEADDEAGRYPDVWDAFAWATGARLGEVAWDRAPLGLRFGIVTPGLSSRIEARLLEGASLRRARGRVRFKGADGGWLTLPVSPGTSFRFFQGGIGTQTLSTAVESGCFKCVRASPNVEYVSRGTAGEGFACVDGSVDLSLLARRVLREEERMFALRRILPGYGGHATDPLTLPFVTDRVLALRCALPARESRLAGGVELWFTIPAEATGIAAIHRGNEPFDDDVIPIGGGGGIPTRSTHDEASSVRNPIRLRVTGEPLAVRPGVTGALHDVTRHPFVRMWDSEGWCGMRARYPTLEGFDWRDKGVAEGISVVLRAVREEGELLLDVSGELRGPPEDLGPFDPGDGAVSIVRSPRLVFESHALPIGSGCVVAEGEGLALRIEGPDAQTSAALQELTFTSPVLGVARLRTGHGARGRLAAGGVWLLPAETATYSSGHGMHEVSTGFVEITDGVTLDLRVAPLRSTVRLDAALRPALLPYALDPKVEPPRANTALRLLDVGQAPIRRELRLDVDGRLNDQGMDPRIPYELEVRVIRPEPRGASR